MSKIKYRYNKESCKYEPVSYSVREIVLNLAGYIGTALVISVGMIFIYRNTFTPIKESNLTQENIRLKSNWSVLNEKLNKVDQSIYNLQIKDDSVYRTILDMKPLPHTSRQAGIGGSERYKLLKEDKLENEKLIINTYHRVDKMKKKLYIQTLSYDEIVKEEKEKEKMWSARPAIQPIHNKELNKLYTTFGHRYHPILKTWRPHNGLDFKTKIGTPVYATGDATVTRASYSHSFGKVVYLDHGYYFKTRYAHLSKFNVKIGDQVKRGDIIGYVGNTGLSQAAHLHYEVHFKNKPVNPIDFFHRDLSTQEYEKLLNIANHDAPSLD